MDTEYEKTNAREWQMGNTPLDYSGDSDYSDDDDYNINPHPSSTLTPSHTNRHPELSQSAVEKPASNKVVTKPKTSLQPQRRIRNTLGFNSDNAGKAAWRARKPHTGTYILSNVHHQAFLSHVNQSVDGLKDNSFSLSSALDGIGVRTGAYIRLPSSLQDHELFIWGHDYNIKDARRALSDLFLHSRSISSKISREKSMPSVHPITQRQQKFYEDKLRNDAHKQKFSQAPEKGLDFLITGAYLWPSTESPPEDILGDNFEALDPIRMFHSCYIVYDHQMSIFKILSNIPYDVKNAIASLGNLLCEYGTRRAVAIERYLVTLPNPSSMTPAVKVVAVPWPKRSEKGDLDRQPLFSGNKLTNDELLKWKEPCESIKKNNTILMCQATLLCLKRMRYYRGSIQMRAHVGMFSLRKYRWTPPNAPTIPLDDFIENMKSSSTKGSLNKLLPAHQESGSLLHRTRKAANLFEPIDTSTHSLDKVEPIYVGMFTFKLNSHEEYKLQVETVPTQGGLGDAFEVTQRMWTKQDKRNAPAMQLFNIRLQGGATWKLHISMEDTVNASQLIPALAEFARSIHVKDHINNHDLEEFSDTSEKSVFDFSKNVMLNSFVQKVAWRYRLRNHSTYQFEVARYDTYRIESNRKVLVATHWGGTIHSDVWDQMFLENITMRHGAMAGWNSSLDTFFAQNVKSDVEGYHTGFMNFVYAAQTVIDFINDDSSG